MENPDWIQNLYWFKEYSDLTIKCESREWRVHKTVVCMQSSFFKSACTKEWKANKSFHIELHEVLPNVVHETIRFLYLSKYYWDETYAPYGPIQFHYKIFIAADKYDIPALASFAEDRFYESLDSFMDDQDFIDTIPLLYDEAPESANAMRKAMVKIAQHNFTEMQEEDSEFREAIKAMVQVVPGFASDMLVDLAARVQKLTLADRSGRKAA